MKFHNIFTDRINNLGHFEDDRGQIIDIFYKTEINHVNQINSQPNVLRGNHKHNHTTQHILIIEGGLEYWYQNESMTISEMHDAKIGDLITSEPGEIHALKIGPKGCKFITFSQGVRGGDDYESDTIRVPSIIRNA